MERRRTFDQARVVRCLDCGTVYSQPRDAREAPQCPNCGYVGWIEVDLPKRQKRCES